MTAMKRLRVGWTGFPGAPGVSTFYMQNDPELTPIFHDFFDAIKDRLPTDVHIQVENVGDVINDISGELTGSWGDTVVDEVVGTDTSGYAAPVGGMIGWETGTITDGHRLRGRTFIVPLGADQYDTDGSLSSACVTDLSDAASTLTTALGDFLWIWHRPRAARAADGSRPAVTARAGSHASVTLSRVPDKSIVLRSRRD